MEQICIENPRGCASAVRLQRDSSERPGQRRSRRPGELSRVFGLALVSLLFVSCVATRKRNPVPEQLAEVAGIPGAPRARFFGDQVPDWLDGRLREVREINSADPTNSDLQPTGCLLAISGGGSNGAFGAGILNGWTEAGNRPRFDMVTGVSTGALIAPFAFLGPEYDHVIKEVYTTIRTSDVLVMRPKVEGLLGDAMTDSTPLRNLIKRYVTEEVRQGIAREYRKGRGLLVATTNVDAGRPVIWSIGALAASDAPNALELIRSALLASASIPGAFPPVYIEVEADGVVYDEMHVDGGASSQVFLYPASLTWKTVADAMGVSGEMHVYVIRNSRLWPRWETTDAKLLPIVGRTIDILIKTQGIGDLYRIYLGAQRDGLNYRLAHIPRTFTEVSSEVFDPEYMQKLYDLGYELAKSGYPWDEAPPGMTPP